MKNKVVDIKLSKPHLGQLKVLQSTARFKVLMCGRRWGKSLISQVIGIMGMVSNKQVAYVTPTYALSKIFFQDVLKLIPASLIKSANKTDLVIQLITGGSLSFLTGERLDNFRGRKFHTVIIDEASYIPDLENAWLNSIRPTLTDYEGDALFISTPRGKGYFHSLYLKGLNKEDGYESFHFNSYSNPYIKASEIDAAKLELPTAAFNQEYLAIPNANSSAVVASEYIEANTITTLSSNPTVVFGIDVAKYTDYTVIIGLDESGSMTYFDRFQSPNEITKQKIKALPADILKAMDSTHGSLGDGIFESLIFDGVQNLVGFEFTSSSKPKLITEMILAIEKGELKFNELTAQELSVFEYTYSSTGYIKYGAISGSHDDAVCALAIANRYKKQAATANYSSWLY